MVGLGGFLGAISRYGLSLLTTGLGITLPIGTLLANVAGTFILGLAFFLSATQLKLPENTYVLLAVGFCGSLTTMSSFILDSHSLLTLKGAPYFLLNVALNLACCFAALLLARWLIGGLK